MLEIVAYLATLTFALLVMVWGGYLNAAQTCDQLNPVLPISAGVLYLAVPVSGRPAHLLPGLPPDQDARPRGYTGVEHIAAEDGVEL